MLSVVCLYHVAAHFFFTSHSSRSFIHSFFCAHILKELKREKREGEVKSGERVHITSHTHRQDEENGENVCTFKTNVNSSKRDSHMAVKGEGEEEERGSGGFKGVKVKQRGWGWERDAV